MAGMRIIELGCGHGLPGIVCALAGAEVSFQVHIQVMRPSVTDWSPWCMATARADPIAGPIDQIPTQPPLSICGQTPIWATCKT